MKGWPNELDFSQGLNVGRCSLKRSVHFSKALLNIHCSLLLESIANSYFSKYRVETSAIRLPSNLVDSYLNAQKWRYSFITLEIYRLVATLRSMQRFHTNHKNSPMLPVLNLVNDTVASQRVI